MFMHGGWMHLIGNMWFLWIYGDNVEDVLGHAKYLLFYLAVRRRGGPGSRDARTHTRACPPLGASGAIAGVMGAYMVKFPHSRIITLVPIFIFFTTMEIPALIMLLYWFVIADLQRRGIDRLLECVSKAASRGSRTSAASLRA